MLQEGKKAPQFTLIADTGETVSLKDYRGQKVVLYFYPKDLTSGCTQEACDFRDTYGKFKKSGIAVLGVSKDPIEKHKKFKEKYSLPFLLLSDLEGKVCEDYEVWKEKSMYGRKYMGIERSTFIISEEGVILKIYRKVKIENHVDEVLAAAKD